MSAIHQPTPHRPFLRRASRAAASISSPVAESSAIVGFETVAHQIENGSRRWLSGDWPAASTTVVETVSPHGVSSAAMQRGAARFGGRSNVPGSIGCRQIGEGTLRERGQEAGAAHRHVLAPAHGRRLECERDDETEEPAAADDGMDGVHGGMWGECGEGGRGKVGDRLS